MNQFITFKQKNTNGKFSQKSINITNIVSVSVVSYSFDLETLCVETPTQTFKFVFDKKEAVRLQQFFEENRLDELCKTPALYAGLE